MIKVNIKTNSSNKKRKKVNYRKVTYQITKIKINKLRIHLSMAQKKYIQLGKEKPRKTMLLYMILKK